MRVPLVFFLSAVVLHSVTAGGAYCAKKARERAAALGLDYPGVSGAPDLSGPPHHEMYPHTRELKPLHYQNNPPEPAQMEYNMVYNRHNLPRTPHYPTQSFPSSQESTMFLLNHGTYSPVLSEYTNTLPGRARGKSVSNLESNFEQVKHVGPPTQTRAPGRSDLVNWASQGRSEPLSFVYNEHDLAVDESVPNRRGMSLSRLSLPQSRGHGVYHRGLGLAELSLGREIPVLGSFRFNNKGHVSAMTSRGLALPTFPGRRVQPLHRNLGISQFVQGNPFHRRLLKTNIRLS